jgi:O-antigen/teichoic acid export membrane protein
LTTLLSDGWRTGGAWALLTLGCTLALAILRTLIIARLLLPEDLGTVAIALLALGFIETITTTGMDTALVSQQGNVEQDLDPAFTVQAIRGAGVAAAMWILAPSVAWVFGNPAAIPVVHAISVVAVLRGLVNPASLLLSRRFEFRRIFWWSLPEMVVGAGLAVGFAYVRRDLSALVIALIGGQMVATAATYGMVPRCPRLCFDWPRIRRLLHFGKWVSGARTLMYLSVTADAFIVGSLLGTQALGLYQFAYRVSELPVLTFSRAVGIVALPGFSELQGRPIELRQAYHGALQLAIGINCLFAVGILLFGEVAIAWLVGARWLPALPVLRILTAAMVFRAVLIVSSQYFDAARQPRLTVRANALRLAALLLSIGPLVSAFGTHGAATSVLLSSITAAGVSLWSSRAMPPATFMADGSTRESIVEEIA